MMLLAFLFALIAAFGFWMVYNAKVGPQATMGATLVFVFTILALGFFFAGVKGAHAHDHARPDLNPWLKTLRNKHTVPCCDGSDATRLSDVDWDTKDGHYRVRLDGKWVDVPPEAVIEEPNRAGQTLVWPYFKDGMMVPRCFMPGSMT